MNAVVTMKVQFLAVMFTGVLLGAEAEARMYQWVSPNTGRVQLSGHPPHWYRDGGSGARVRVFENGNLVDDTAIALPRKQRESLREAAFLEYQQRQRVEALKRLERAARRAALRQEQEQERLLAEKQRDGAVGARADAGAASPDSALPADDEPLDAGVVARLKALVREFDRQGGAAAPR